MSRIASSSHHPVPIIYAYGMEEPGFYPQVQPVRLTVSMIICAREIKKDWNYGHRFGKKIDDLQAPLFTYDLGQRSKVKVTRLEICGCELSSLSAHLLNSSISSKS